MIVFTNRGFTLIELLVVIAIIGTLSAVVLASLNNARGKGADSAVKSQMAAARSQAELYFEANNYNYTNICGTSAVNGVYPIGAMLLSASNVTNSGAVVTNNATAGVAAATTCHANSGAWAAEAPLKSNTSSMWCVDSTGASKGIGTSHIGSNIFVCP